MAVWAVAAQAVPAPCGGTGLEPITNPSSGGQIYCESAFGWSDTWFPTSNTVSSYVGGIPIDVFSGNDAPGLIWSGIPTNTNTNNNSNVNNNTFSPVLDSNPATLGMMLSNSPWSVTPTGALTVVGNTATSTISDGPVQVQIVTTVGTGGVVTFTYTIKNTSTPAGIDTGTVTGLELFDYFNFHPYGSNASPGNNSYNCSTASYNSTTGTINVVGTATCTNTDGSTDTLVANGSLTGSSLPSSCDIGTTAAVLSNLTAIQTTTVPTTPLPNTDCTSTGTGAVPGDYAGALEWTLADIPDGGTDTFTITKDAVLPPPPPPPPPPVPEPASLALFGTAIIGLAMLSRRKRS